MKKILIFSTAYHPFIGGAEIAVKEITDRLARDHEYEFHMITARFDRSIPKNEIVGNINVHRVGIGISLVDKLLLPLLGSVSAIHLDKRVHFDVFWPVMITFASGIPYILNLLPFRRKVPIILTLQEGSSEKQLVRRWLWMRHASWKLALRRTNLLTCISTYLEKRARSLGYKGDSVIIPNAVDVAHFDVAVSEEELQSLKNQLGKKEGEVWIVTTSRMVEKNALDDVIRALSLVPDTVHFSIYGGGPDEQKLRDLTEKLNLAERVHFAGFIEHKNLPKHLKVFDIFIRPSRSEGFGNSFVEAMVVGLPVIATQEGGLSDFIFDQKRNPNDSPTAWVVDKDNPKQIAEAIKDIVANQDKVNEITGNARKMVFEKYDWNIIAKDMHTKAFGRI